MTVGMVISQLAGGRPSEELLSADPHLERADILAALRYATAAVNGYEVPIARRSRVAALPAA